MPPKKKQLKVTPFTLFMKYRNSELTTQGLEFTGGWKDVAAHISDEWTNMDENEKFSWKAKAESINAQGEIKRERNWEQEYAGATCSSSSSTDFPKKRPGYMKQFLNCEVQNPEATIMNFLKNSECPFEEIKFPIVHFNSYGRHYTSHMYFPSEYALGSFSLKNGIGEESFGGSIIDPGVLPIEASIADMETAMEKTLLLRPPYFLQSGLGYYSGLHTQDEFSKIFRDTVQRSLLMEDVSTGRKIHILFAPEENDIVDIRGCILWLMMKCDKEFDFEILKLTTLMKLISFQKTQNDYSLTGIWDEKDAQLILNDSVYNYATSLGCKWHQREENVYVMNHCSTNIVTRSIYLALQSLCEVFELDNPIPSHSPDLKIKVSEHSGVKIVGAIEFRQRFGIQPVDAETRKFLRGQFVLDDFLDTLRHKYPRGLQQQPSCIIWPKRRKIEDDLNYSKHATIKIQGPEDPPSEDEPDTLNWDWCTDTDTDSKVGEIEKFEVDKKRFEVPHDLKYGL